MFLRQGQNPRVWVTKQANVAILSAQISEKNGGDDGTRTRGLCRDSEIFNRN